jgi:hypothetical protein
MDSFKWHPEVARRIAAGELTLPRSRKERTGIGVVYLLGSIEDRGCFSLEAVKIGKTEARLEPSGDAVVNQRWKTLQTAHWLELRPFACFFCSTPDDAYKLEDWAHTRFSGSCIRGEWFNIDPQLAIMEIRGMSCDVLGYMPRVEIYFDVIDDCYYCKPEGGKLNLYPLSYEQRVS